MVSAGGGLLDPWGGLPASQAGGLPAAGGLATLPADVGFPVATGDSGLIAEAAKRFSNVAGALTGHAGTVQGTAGSLASSWTGLAASSYQELSSIITTHFEAAAGSSRTVATSLNRYASELERCQREGMTATWEAERCLKEIQAQTTRLQAARDAASAAQGALSAARAEGAIARAAGPLGAPFAAVAHIQASASQTALTGAQSDQQAATRELQHAQDELAMWQARGRRAWDEAQTAADRATGSLQALTIVPPPLAGIAPLAPLIATAPFALPGEQCWSSPGEGEAPTTPGGLLIDPIPESLPWNQVMTGTEPAFGSGLIADPVPENPPVLAGTTGREPVPGENTIADPAPEPCGRVQVTNGGGKGNTLSGGQSDGQAERGSGAVTSQAPPDPANLTSKIERQMQQRGWTAEEIQKAYENGEQVPAVNKATGSPATRYVNPDTGQSMVVDDGTGQVIHVGGPGFRYGSGSGDKA
jgi:uncharacterized protein YukE